MQYSYCKIWDICFFLCFFSLCVSGCAPQTKDKLLRVFFDGVPAAGQDYRGANAKSDVDVIVAEEIKVTGVKLTKEPSTFFHPPYIEKQCDSCHESKFSQKLTLPLKELCFTCHDDFTKDKKVIHYPVSEGACLECHDPHQSVNKNILKKSVPQICFTCHEEKDIRANPAHEGQNNCMECHNAHASNEEKLFK